MKLCPPCNKSRHYNCRGCECKCQRFKDMVTKDAEPERLSDPENDDYVDDILTRWREIQH